MSCAFGISYIVQPGDTLFNIAERKLGDGNRWTEIKNPDGTAPNPTQLQPGQELCLPGAPSTGSKTLNFLRSISGLRTVAGQHNREPNSEFRYFSRI